MSDESKRDFSRQSSLVPEERLAPLSIAVVGCGAIGRNVAVQLALIGARKIHLIDFDAVDMSNVTTQGFLPSDVGDLKTLAIERALLAIDDSITIYQHATKWRQQFTAHADVIFSCPDRIDVRQEVFDAHRADDKLIIDGRMLAESMQVYSAIGNCPRYAGTFFDMSEREEGRCTAKSTIYSASICAGLMVHQFTRWLRDAPLDHCLLFDLQTSALLVPNELQTI